MDALAPLNTATPQALQNTYQRQVSKPRNWGESLSDAEKRSIHKAAEKFEAMYVSDMMNYMFTDTDMSGNAFGGGPGEKMYQSLMVNEYGNTMAKSGQAGIAPVLEREMLRLQELQRNPRLANEVTSAAATSLPHNQEVSHDATQPAQ